MNVTVTDSQILGETEGVAFSLTQNSPVAALITLTNSGVNTANYRFQFNNGAIWVDMDALGTDLNNTLSPKQTKTVKLSSPYPQVQLLGNASGGTEIDFAVLRFFDRGSGGDLPLLNV